MIVFLKCFLGCVNGPNIKTSGSRTPTGCSSATIAPQSISYTFLQKGRKHIMSEVLKCNSLSKCPLNCDTFNSEIKWHTLPRHDSCPHLQDWSYKSNGHATLRLESASLQHALHKSTWIMPFCDWNDSSSMYICQVGAGAWSIRVASRVFPFYLQEAEGLRFKKGAVYSNQPEYWLHVWPWSYQATQLRMGQAFAEDTDGKHIKN